MSFFFFFFKQKTAYEIRKGDWSSDVCSSDLHPPRAARGGAGVFAAARPGVPAGAKRAPDRSGQAGSSEAEPDLAPAPAPRSGRVRLRVLRHFRGSPGS